MAKVRLVPIPAEINGSIFDAITRWRYEDDFVLRILTDDIPQRVKYENAKIWVYRDPENEIVGFGTLSLCDDYRELTGGKRHTYIPLLAVRPDKRGLGHGTTIVRHLIDEAACFVANDPKGLHAAVFLDVYEESLPAFNLYVKCGFQTIGDWFSDSLNGKRYRVMAMRVSG